jgi:hypothetical protein
MRPLPSELLHLPNGLAFLALEVHQHQLLAQHLSHLPIISSASWLALTASLLRPTMHGGYPHKCGLPASLRGPLLILCKCLASLMHLSLSLCARGKSETSPSAQLQHQAPQSWVPGCPPWSDPHPLNPVDCLPGRVSPTAEVNHLGCCV